MAEGSAGLAFEARVVEEALEEDPRPQPAGQWGAVFAGDEEASKPALVLLAVGERHPARPWRPSVYEIAPRRLHRDD